MKRFQKINEEWVELNESFMRLPNHMIRGELYEAKNLFESIYSTLIKGNDFQLDRFNTLIGLLKNIKDNSKSFDNEEDVPATYKYKSN